MFSITRTLRNTTTRIPQSCRLLTTTARQSKDLRVDEPSAKGLKSDIKQNINQKSKPAPDNEDEYSAQASRGKLARENYSGGKENADTRGDPGNMNKKAEAEHPEAPRPVIGMKEERGKVSNARREEERVGGTIADKMIEPGVNARTDIRVESRTRQ